MRAIGMAERALEMMCRRTAARSTFGQPIIEHGVVQRWISEARVRIEQVRLLVLKTAWLMDTVGNRGARIEVSAIKVAAPEVATWVIDRAIQAYGGAGVSQDYAAGRAVRGRADPPDRRRPRRGSPHGDRPAREPALPAARAGLRRRCVEMKMLSKNSPAAQPTVTCAVCRTHSRPLYVPWQQHTIGCSVRAADLERRQLQLRAGRVAPSIASSF